MLMSDPCIAVAFISDSGSGRHFRVKGFAYCDIMHLEHWCHKDVEHWYLSVYYEVVTLAVCHVMKLVVE